MNIVIVIDLIDNLTNGSVITARRFADGLKERGHGVKIVAVGSADCPLSERYVPILSEVAAKNRIKFANFEKDKIKAAFEGADVVHFIFPFKLEKKCKRLADKMGVATTAAFHVQPENVSYNARLGWCKPFNRLVYAYFRRTFYKKFKRVHCPSAFIANQLKNHGYDNELCVISNGYDKDFVPPQVKPVNEKFEVIMVGRLSPEKNQKVLISAIARSKYRDKIHLTLLGGGACGKSLEKQAKRENVCVDFAFLNKQELIKKLQGSDLYVHTAKVEIEAIACLEAIACGLLPVISDSRLSATPQFALDNRSLFEDGNPTSLAAAIDYWYERRDEREKMGAEYAKFAKKFSLDNSLDLAEKMFAAQILDTALVRKNTSVLLSYLSQ